MGKKKKEEEQESTLVQIGIKAGLPLLFSLIRRSWRRDDSELCSEVFITANEILLSLPPLSLYHHEMSSLGRDSLDNVAKFLKSSLLPNCPASISDKQNAIMLLLEFVSQRGLLRHILDC